eukprot:3529364-Lingulodinium_polyedra.AAC.1
MRIRAHTCTCAQHGDWLTGRLSGARGPCGSRRPFAAAWSACALCAADAANGKQHSWYKIFCIASHHITLHP